MTLAEFQCLLGGMYFGFILTLMFYPFNKPKNKKNHDKTTSP